MLFFADVFMGKELKIKEFQINRQLPFCHGQYINIILLNYLNMKFEKCCDFNIIYTSIQTYG